MDSQVDSRISGLSVVLLQGSKPLSIITTSGIEKIINQNGLHTSIGVLVGLAIVAALAALIASVWCISRPGNHQGHFSRWVKKGVEIRAHTVEEQNAIGLPRPSTQIPDSLC